MHINNRLHLLNLASWKLMRHQSWYRKKFKKAVNPNHMIPLGHALQGHPEAGTLWEKMIVEILETYFGFKSTTHEQNIYWGEIKRETVFVCCQVDDFAIALDSIEIVNHIISEIDKHVSLPTKGLGQNTMGWTSYKLVIILNYIVNLISIKFSYPMVGVNQAQQIHHATISSHSHLTVWAAYKNSLDPLKIWKNIVRSKKS